MSGIAKSCVANQIHAHDNQTDIPQHHDGKIPDAFQYRRTAQHQKAHQQVKHQCSHCNDQRQLQIFSGKGAPDICPVDRVASAGSINAGSQDIDNCHNRQDCHQIGRKQKEKSRTDIAQKHLVSGHRQQMEGVQCPAVVKVRKQNHRNDNRGTHRRQKSQCRQAWNGYIVIGVLPNIPESIPIFHQKANRPKYDHRDQIQNERIPAADDRILKDRVCAVYFGGTGR